MKKSLRKVPIRKRWECGWHSKLYQDIVGFGFGFFYLYIMLTSPGTLAFTYLLPILCMMVIYKNRGFYIRCGIAVVIVLVVTIVRNYMNGMNTPSDISNYEIQVAIIIFCFAGFIVAINHLIKSDGAMLDSVKDNLARVVQTVEQVKVASNSVVDGVAVVRELAEENKDGAGIVVESMEDLVAKSNELSQKIHSSMEMTEDIDQQVINVAELVTHIVDYLSGQSAERADSSTKELENAVSAANAMTESVVDSETTTTTMMSKYEETARNITNIETVVGHLVEELGAGGFMSTEDITVGMSVEICEHGSKVKYETEVAGVKEDIILLDATAKTETFLGDTHKKKYDISIVVNNAMYIWNEVAIKKTGHGDKHYEVVIEGNPKVMNRRKHPRLPMNNACKDAAFAEVVGERVQLTIQNFALMDGKSLGGIVIRSTNDHGTYIVGCRMLQDNKEIEAYVAERMK